jgi:hypothetical protein
MSVHTHVRTQETLSPAERWVTFGEVPAQAWWLMAGLGLAFGVPFVLADLAELQRDLYYALYVASVYTFVGLWARKTQQPVRGFLTLRWRLAVSLGVAAAVLLTFIVLKEPST